MPCCDEGGKVQTSPFFAFSCNTSLNARLKRSSTVSTFTDRVSALLNAQGEGEEGKDAAKALYEKRPSQRADGTAHT
jgi:hypothetical protein